MTEAAPPAKPGSAKKSSTLPICIAVVVIAALGATGFFFLKSKAPVDESPKTAPTSTAPAPVKVAAPATPVAVPAAKSVDDFKVSEIKIQRPKDKRGSRLVYAVGTLTNTSSIARLGVRIDLVLFNEQGAKVDETSDYQATIGAGEVWNFHAVVHDLLAISGKVAKITEDN